MRLTELNRRFDLLEPVDSSASESCDAVREKIKETADLVAFEAPPSREQGLALTKLEEALYWAIAAIVRHPD